MNIDEVEDDSETPEPIVAPNAHRMTAPLTPNEIRAAIEGLIDAMSDSCNSGHIDHTDGVLRGLLWALTGQDHGTYLSEDMGNVLTLARIPYTEGEDGFLYYDLKG